MPRCGVPARVQRAEPLFIPVIADSLGAPLNAPRTAQRAVPTKTGAVSRCARCWRNGIGVIARRRKEAYPLA